jgi:hypothetical protein
MFLVHGGSIRGAADASFLLGGRLFALSDLDDVAEEGVRREDGGPREAFWHLSIPNRQKMSRGRIAVLLTDTA